MVEEVNMTEKSWLKGNCNLNKLIRIALLQDVCEQRFDRTEETRHMLVEKNIQAEETALVRDHAYGF